MFSDPVNFIDPSGKDFNAIAIANAIAHTAHAPVIFLAVQVLPRAGVAAAGLGVGFAIGYAINVSCGGNCFPGLGPWTYDLLHPDENFDLPLEPGVCP